MIDLFAKTIIAGRQGTYRHLTTRVYPQLADSGQIADLLAGAARVIVENELLGIGDSTVTAALRPLIDEKSVWGDDNSWNALTGES